MSDILNGIGLSHSNDEEDPDWATDIDTDVDEVVKPGKTITDLSTSTPHSGVTTGGAGASTGVGVTGSLGGSQGVTGGNGSTVEGENLAVADKPTATATSSVDDYDDEEEFSFAGASLHKDATLGIYDGDIETTDIPEEDDGLGLPSKSQGIAKGKSPIATGGMQEAFDKAADDDVEYLSYEDKAQIAADKLIAQMLRGGPKNAEMRRWFYSRAIPGLFKDENYLIYDTLYRMRGENFTVDNEFMELYLNMHLEDVEKASGQVNLEKHPEVDGSRARGFIAGTLGHMKSLADLPEMDEEEFRLTYEKYTIYYQYIEGSKTYMDALQILQDGLKPGNSRTLKSGFDSSVEFVRRSTANIDGKVDKGNGTGFQTLKDMILNPEEVTSQPRLVGSFGQIEELNKHYGGIYSGMLITIAGPTKGGKTKLCTRIIYDAYVNGENISAWPVEGGKEMFMAQMRAIHFHEVYNAGKPVSEWLRGVNQVNILHGKLDELSSTIPFAELESQSAMDLVMNVKHGSLDIIDRTFDVDTFIDDIELSITSNDSSIAYVDYVQLLQSKRGLSGREALESAYPRILDLTKKYNTAFISPAQYSQNSIRDLSKSKGDMPDMRTAIGESAAIFRSSDLVISMFSTPEEIKQKQVRFVGVPSRVAQPFDTFSAYADLGSCYFSSMESE